MRKWAVILPLGFVVLYAGPFVVGDLFGPFGPGDEVRPEPGQLVELADGRSLSVHELGSPNDGGRTLILIHGWSSHAGDWAEVPARLHALGHHVVVYDRPGYGYSTRERSPDGNFSLSSNARDLLQLMNALGIEQAALVGWSFGGGVAQRLAIDHPERVSHLALVGSVGPPHPQPEAEDDGGLIRSILHSPLAVPVLEWMSALPPLAYVVTEQNVARAFSGKDNVPTGWTISTQAMLSLPGTADAIAGEVQRSEANPDPSRITQPTLVFHGSDDALISFAIAEALHGAVPNSALEAVVGGHHMLPVTHGERLTRHLHELVGTSYRAGQLPGDAASAGDGAPAAPRRETAGPAAATDSTPPLTP